MYGLFYHYLQLLLATAVLLEHRQFEEFDTASSLPTQVHHYEYMHACNHS